MVFPTGCKGVRRNPGYSSSKHPERLIQWAKTTLRWKIADITPLPKVKQVTDPKKELRPISLTSTLSKISEDFFLSDYIKPALENLVDSNQFGTISGSSTVLALISMIHKWLEATDGNSASVRVLLYDYGKAFDLIDHKILVNKLKQVNIPDSVINWVIDFPSGRSRRVKLGKDCFSEWETVPSECHRGQSWVPGVFFCWSMTWLSQVSSTCVNTLVILRYQRAYLKANRASYKKQ